MPNTNNLRRVSSDVPLPLKAAIKAANPITIRRNRLDIAIMPMLSDHFVILGDNSHDTDKLLVLSQEIGRRRVFFAEKPADHSYPGSGIGISLPWSHWNKQCRAMA